MIVDMEKKTFKIRGLTRGEIRKLIAEGVEPDGVMALEKDKQSDAIDAVLKVVVPDYKPDDVTPAEQLELYLKVQELTYLGDGDLKKFAALQKTGAGENSGSATSAAPKGLQPTGDAPGTEDG